MNRAFLNRYLLVKVIVACLSVVFGYLAYEKMTKTDLVFYIWVVFYCFLSTLTLNFRGDIAKARFKLQQRGRY